MRHDPRFVLLALLAACGGARPLPRGAASARPVTATAPSDDLSGGDADACVEAASRASFAPYIAPTGGDAFRSHLAARIGDLGCCFTRARRELLDGDRLRIAFEPRAGDPSAGAAARLIEPDDATHPNERRCLRSIVAGWQMDHAPVSDVVRSPRPDVASVTILYPLRFGSTR